MSQRAKAEKRGNIKQMQMVANMGMKPNRGSCVLPLYFCTCVCNSSMMFPAFVPQMDLHDDQEFAPLGMG